jgi:hypothetical protein
VPKETEEFSIIQTVRKNYWNGPEEDAVVVIITCYRMQNQPFMTIMTENLLE